MRRAENLAQSFRFAFRGLWYALTTQRNLRIHLLAATLVMGLGWVLALPRRDFIGVLTAVMVVMVAEMVNTAVEAAVDLASPEFHQLAAIAKDVAAGAVLLAALGAAALGLWVFGSRLGQVPADFMIRWRESPAITLGVLAVAAMVLALVIWIPVRYNRGT